MSSLSTGKSINGPSSSQKRHALHQSKTDGFGKNSSPMPSFSLSPSHPKATWSLLERKERSSILMESRIMQDPLGNISYKRMEKCPAHSAVEESVPLVRYRKR